MRRCKVTNALGSDAATTKASATSGSCTASSVQEPRRRGGFTLVELLVVIGIIALLLAILLPTLSSVRQAGRGTACLSNLKQMATALTQYAVDHQTQLPPAYMSQTFGDTTHLRTWDTTTIRRSGLVEDVVPGTLWQSTDPSAVQQCPEFSGRANWQQDGFTGYNYNTTYLGVGGVRLARARSPAETAAFGDGQFAGGANKFMRAPRHHNLDGTLTSEGVTSLRLGGMQGFRHRGRTNAAWLDGHASQQAERFDTFDHNGGTATCAEPLGFLDEDNALYDLQ